MKASTKFEWKSVIPLLLAAGLFLRALVIILGDYIDKTYYPVKFTDIDYRVYTEAAQYVNIGASPYERQTYRYPPILAQILVGNIILHPSFGKYLFALFDTLIGYELYHIIRIDARNIIVETAVCWTCVWCFNPVAIYICCRGSVDSISSWLVLLTLRLMLHQRYTFAAIVLGFSIYFRMYPIIYLPLLLCYILLRDNKRVPTIASLRDGIFFSCSVLCTVGCFVYMSFVQYGQDYLQHAIFYHFSREDHRHNFSPIFYSTYLQMFGSFGPFALEFPWNLAVVKKIPFLCQIILLLLFSCKVHTLSLPRCMLLSTIIFVAFNSVITGQYFLWYLILFPVAFPTAFTQKTLFLVPFVFLGLTLCWWLYNAYNLEFNGENTFLTTWVASLLFLGAHCCLIVICLQAD